MLINIEGAQNIGFIYETENYDIFKKMTGNRDVKANQKLKASIENKGQLQPILINSKFEVLDGQHRLAVLKELGRPIKFVLSEVMGSSEQGSSSGAQAVSNVRDMNNSQKEWRDEDYLKSYADEGKVDYLRLQSFYRSNKLNLKLVIAAGNGKRHGSGTKVTNNFREGTYKFCNEANLKNFVEFYELFLRETMHENSNPVQNVMWTLFTVPNFNEKRMIKKFNGLNMKNRLFKVTDHKIILKELVDAYNDSVDKSSSTYIKHSFDSKGSLILSNY